MQWHTLKKKLAQIQFFHRRQNSNNEVLLYNNNKEWKQNMIPKQTFKTKCCTFSIKLIVISTGTIFPSFIQVSIRSPFSEPLALSTLNNSPADKWMYPNSYNKILQILHLEWQSNPDIHTDRYIRQETGIMKNYKINTVEPCLVRLFSYT